MIMKIKKETIPVLLGILLILISFVFSKFEIQFHQFIFVILSYCFGLLLLMTGVVLKKKIKILRLVSYVIIMFFLVITGHTFKNKLTEVIIVKEAEPNFLFKTIIVLFIIGSIVSFIGLSELYESFKLESKKKKD